MKNIKFKTKSEIIHAELKQAIIGGAYQPRQRIIIANVAKNFGTSEIPVREALKNLESEGLIRITPHVGAVVTDLRLDEIKEIYQVRSLLEGKAAQLAAENIKQRDFELLEDIITDMENAVQDDQFEKLGQLNRKFHENVYSACNNQFLRKQIFELWDLSSRASGVFAMVPERAHESVREHKEIFQALKKRDGKLAQKLVTKQKERSLNSLERFIKDKENTETDHK